MCMGGAVKKILTALFVPFLLQSYLSERNLLNSWNGSFLTRHIPDVAVAAGLSVSSPRLAVGFLLLSLTQTLTRHPIKVCPPVPLSCIHTYPKDWWPFMCYWKSVFFPFPIVFHRSFLLSASSISVEMSPSERLCFLTAKVYGNSGNERVPASAFVL